MDKNAVVTGAGTGIGQATSLAMLKEGWNVYLVGRREKKLYETKKIALLKKYKGEAIIFPSDISNEDSVKELYSLVNKKYKSLDVLFNNAGISLKSNTIDKINYSDWKNVINTNINGMFLMAKYAFKTMKNQKNKGGRIINNGSISAYAPRPGSAAYTTSKHAITGLTKTISLDGRSYNIACSQIDIGNAATPMTKDFTKGIMQPNGKLLSEPVMSVSDVADAVIYISKLPLNSNVLNMTIMSNSMPFVGRG